jgi:hypothetical protein
MKAILQTLILALASLALSSRAASVSITPSTVSNTYTGRIAFIVSGLNAGDSVVVQKFLDANTNGVIDSGDPLVQQFQMTDGQAGMVIGSVTNFNVPGDTDGSSNSQITAKWNFQAGDFMQNIAGKFIYKVSGNFSPPVTNSFIVTNFPWAQKFTGTVVSNGTSTTLPNAVVLAFPPNGNGPPEAGTVADSSGNYVLPVPAGTYSLVAFKGGYVGDFGSAPTFALGSSATISTNLTLTVATATISGSIVDAANPNIGLPGILMPVQANNGLMSVTFTDTNGNFTAGVQSGQWKVKPDDTSLIVHGYLGLQNNIKTNDGASGVIIAVPKANALIYGSVKDNLGNPFAALDVYANDINSQYETDAYTDANGNYVLAVQGFGSSDPWQLQANNNDAVINYVFTQPNSGSNNGTNINESTAVPINFSALLATNHITGNIQFNGTNVVGVGVSANFNDNGTNYHTFVDTDANGNYWLNVANGYWDISLNQNGGNDSLDGILGNGMYQIPNDQFATIANNNSTNNFTVLPIGGGGGGQIYGYVKDTNSNPITGVTVYASDGNTGYYSTSTDGSGYFSFTVGNTNWDVSMDCTQLGNLGYQCPGDQIVNISNNNTEVDFTVQAQFVSSPLQVTTTSLPGGTNGVFYSQQLQLSGGQPPYTWSLSPGSGSLPTGLSLSTNGVISGTPTATGTFNFSVRATDSAAATADQPLSVTVSSVPLQITTVSLPNATQNAFYYTALTVTGGTPPYIWSLSPGSASLPTGLSLSTNGVISGTPGGSGTNTFIVLATDSTMAWSYQVLSLAVVASTNAPTINLTAPTAVAGGQFQFTFKAVSGITYTIQYSTDLKNWVNYSTYSYNNGNGNSGEKMTITLPDPAGANQCFYRVKVGL